MADKPDTLAGWRNQVIDAYVFHGTLSGAAKALGIHRSRVHPRPEKDETLWHDQKNRRGAPAHSEPDGSDWALSAWCNAGLGELGELANLIKKVERGDLTLDEARADLGRETASKFNEVSRRVGSPVMMDETDSGYPYYGNGRTEAEAIAYLREQLEDE